MKSMYVLVLLFVINLVIPINVFSQNDPFAVKNNEEKSQGERAGEVIKYLNKFYEENYFSDGYKKTEMSGTGYYPYQRQKWFYEMRADENGEIPYLKRWMAFEESKKNHLIDKQISASANWKNLGPTNNGGRTISHAFDPIDSQIIWIGSAAGGLWRTPDGGDSWQPMTDQLPSLSVGAVAINPQDPNIMLLGTGEAYGGIFMVDGVGILKSTDGGLTWSQTNFIYQQIDGVNCYSIVWDQVNPNNIYAACNNGLWRSTDMGDTWSNLLNGRATAVVINKKSPNIIYTIIQGIGFYKSIDSGDTWNRLSSGLPSTSLIGFTSLAICDSFPNVLYAGIAENGFGGKMQGFYKTSDGGNNWMLIPTQDFYCYTPPYEYICQGWYDNVTAVSPIDSNIVFANGINLYKSIDGGITWTTPAGALPNPSVHVDHHSFGFDPANPQVVYSFNDGGVYKSTDGGENWTEKNDGLVTFQFYSIASAMTDTNIVTGGSQDNTTQVVNNANGNTDWQIWWYGDGMICNIDYTNENIMYGEKEFGFHGKTINGGQSSFSINNGITENGPWITPVVMDPVDPQILYTASEAKIYKTTNGGLLWTALTSVQGCKLLEVDKVNTNYIYASAYSFSAGGHYLWKSADAGLTWNLATSPGWRVTDLMSSPVLEGVLYATQNAFDGNPRVYKSIDYGDSWTEITNNLPDIGINGITINPYNSDHLYLATDLGVYFSMSDGNEWYEFNDGLPNVFTFDIHFHPVDTTVRIGTFGRGYWKTKAALFSVSSINGGDETEISTNFTLYKNYPNPFNLTTTIHYNLHKSTNVKIKIFNETGQEIVELYSGFQNSGNHTIRWNGTNSNGLSVSSGIYFSQLSVNRVSQVQKLVLFK